MIKWYADSDVAIFFSEKPDLTVRFPEPGMSANQVKDINKKPFLNKKEIEIILFDLKISKRYKFTAKKNYTWDGASIPTLFWRIIGSKSDNRFLIPSLVHDLLCENHCFVNNDRYFADKVFERLLYVSGVPAFKRWLMFHSVDNFQKFQGWRAK